MTHERSAGLIRKLVVLSGLISTVTVYAQDIDPQVPDEGSSERVGSMTAERLGQLILNVDENAKRDANSWSFKVAELDAIVIYDENADRMRIVIPIDKVEKVDDEEMLRLMQANFDSALDARYAVAQGLLWGTFIHPLSSLTDEEFLVGLGETANVVMSFGTSYSSGLFIFNGGDSAGIEQQKLIEQLKKQKI